MIYLLIRWGYTLCFNYWGYGTHFGIDVVARQLGGHFFTNRHVEGPNTTGRIEWCTERLYGVMPDHLHTWGHVSYLRVSGIHHLNLDQIRVAKNWSFACMIYMAW